ncbi:MAG: ABC transporter permease [Tannerella sp.]|jgi:putative ABC transport system permease protein|nr:ABC transporter permease [Tannerella sp.]
MSPFTFWVRTSLHNKKYSTVKIVSLGVGLAMGLVLIAKVYFEKSYNDFFPDKERIYQAGSNYSTTEGTKAFPQTSGGIVLGMEAELPGVESATRYTYLSVGKIITADKNKYKAVVITADSCLFDVFRLPILAGDAKKTLSRPMYAMVSSKIAEEMGGTAKALGQTFHLNEYPGQTLTIGGVFQAVPKNTNLDYDVVVSLASIGKFTWDGSRNWVGNDRYLSYLKFAPGIKPDKLKPELEKMKAKYLPLEHLKKAGVGIDYFFKPIREIHSSDADTQRMTLILSLLAVALLVTAVMNYVLVVISSLVGRSKEMAVNKCYGATSNNIYTRMLGETFFDLVAALLLGALLVFACRGAIFSLLGTGLGDLFTLPSCLLLAAVCVLVFFVAAFAPGYLYARIPVAVAFRQYTESKRRWKLGLLFLQFAAAGLFVTLLCIIGKQYHYMMTDNPGYNYENLAYCSLDGVKSDLRQKALDEAAGLPGVSAVTTADVTFLQFQSGNNISLPGDDKELFNVADLYSCGNGYLQMLHVPVVEGRSFTENVSSSDEVMVSRSFVKKILPLTHWTDGVVGKNILISEHSDKGKAFTICGVYEDFRLGNLGRQDTRPSIMFYNSKPSSFLYVKFDRLTPDAMKALSDKLSALMPDKDIEVYSFADTLQGDYAESRNFRDSILAGGLVTLLICLMGLIGYTNDEVNRRRKETAIRKVNGATAREILRIFLHDISRMALPASILGCMGAYFIAKIWLEKFAEKTSLSFLLFVVCVLGVWLIVIAAAVLNCRRAVNANPADSLKAE